MSRATPRTRCDRATESLRPAKTQRATGRRRAQPTDAQHLRSSPSCAAEPEACCRCEDRAAHGVSVHRRPGLCRESRAQFSR